MNVGCALTGQRAAVMARCRWWGDKAISTNCYDLMKAMAGSRGAPRRYQRHAAGRWMWR
ncbi:hypothetical protein KCP73_15870 [Salmonella enterica subsp. enterica]|nr:hypothetical protein KCP73_15870 [Salmonella enterica subsp. enterica]